MEEIRNAGKLMCTLSEDGTTVFIIKGDRKTIISVGSDGKLHYENKQN